MELQKEARGSKKQVRHPHGHVWDPEWRDNHPEEVAERLEREREATRTRKRKTDDRQMIEAFTSTGLEALHRARASPSS
ncbi:hypothetical protein I203_107793 [Kwoniella mangroviensis CBS 8507]|uniref:hypothetical protein n=1 Tax=Kwoniella mangroviensis CBS 8507 TaxID=1296122 RepID=UPI00302C3039